MVRGAIRRVRAYRSMTTDTEAHDGRMDPFHVNNGTWMRQMDAADRSVDGQPRSQRQPRLDFRAHESHDPLLLATLSVAKGGDRMMHPMCGGGGEGNCRRCQFCSRMVRSFLQTHSDWCRRLYNPWIRHWSASDCLRLRIRRIGHGMQPHF